MLLTSKDIMTDKKEGTTGLDVEINNKHSISATLRKTFFEKGWLEKLSTYPDLRLSSTVSEFDRKVLSLRLRLHHSREDLSKSHPNLEEMEKTVRSSLAIDRSGLGAGPLPLPTHPVPVRTFSRGTNTDLSFHCHSAWLGPYDSVWTHAKPTPPPSETESAAGPYSGRDEWTDILNRATRFYSPASVENGSCGTVISFSKILESDLDTTVCTDSNTSQELSSSVTSEVKVVSDEEEEDDDESTDVQSEDEYADEKKDKYFSWDSETNINDSVSQKNITGSYFPSPPLRSSTLSTTFVVEKTQSMLNLGTAGGGSTSTAQKSNTLSPYGEGASPRTSDERARSMEFLINDSNKNSHLLPPENTLMLQSQENRQPSEHELRIQRSLDKLNVPDWYKKYGAAGGPSGGAKSPGSRSSASGQKNFGTGLAGGWAGLSSSKTSSLTSLQSTGRYTGRTPPTSTRLRSAGTTSTGGRSSRESLMSPSSTASASPSPYYERSSFTYGMPYALTRFATARMSCGASPASLSPSPSPVGGLGSSTSTPTASGPSSRHHHGGTKQPYLGWRSQERLTSKTLYRTPAERLASDLLEQQNTTKVTVSVTDSEKSSINMEISPKKETTVATSDLSLNISEESTNSHKLRVISSIKEVSNAIVDYVNESKPLDEGMNGASPRRGLVWLESSFVGTKPIDSDDPPVSSVVINTPKKMSLTSPEQVYGQNAKKALFRYGDGEKSSDPSPVPVPNRESTTPPASVVPTKSGPDPVNSSPPIPASTATTTAPYYSRNEQMEERLSNSSTVSSPTLDDILDSLLALRRPTKKVKARGGTGPPPSTTTLMKGSGFQPSPSASSTSTGSGGGCPTVISKIESSFLHNPNAQVGFEFQTLSSGRMDRSPNKGPSPTPPKSPTKFNQPAKVVSPKFDPPTKVISPVSDWQLRMNQPLLDSTGYFPETDDFFVPRVIQTPEQQFLGNHNTVSVEGGLSMSPEAEVSVVGEGEELEALLGGDNHSGSTAVGEDEVDSFVIPTTESTSYRAPGIVNPSVAAAIHESGQGQSNPSSPRHRRVSFDLDIEDKEEKSSSRSKKEDSAGLGTINCRNSKCGKSATGLEARREFKTCHNCNAYYCTRECRRAHWEKHKKVCMQSRVGALCKQIISHVKDDSDIVSHLSTIAKRGLLAKGRGCVKLFFSSPDRAERFLTGGFPELPEPWYIRNGDVLPEEMGAQVFTELNDQIQTYNTENRFVLYVSLCVVNEVPTSGAVKWEREMISRSAKLRLLLPRSFDAHGHHQVSNPAHQFPGDSSTASTPPLEPDTPFYYDPAPPFPADEFLPPPPGEGETLILRSVPTQSTRQLSTSEHRRMREVTFANIQKHLSQRGVELRRTYPDIYSKLCSYVENDEPFIPVTIYPRNTITGNQFVCIIMPESADTDTPPPPFDPTRHIETINISGLSFDSH